MRRSRPTDDWRPSPGLSGSSSPPGRRGGTAPAGRRAPPAVPHSGSITHDGALPTVPYGSWHSPRATVIVLELLQGPIQNGRPAAEGARTDHTENHRQQEEKTGTAQQT